MCTPDAITSLNQPQSGSPGFPSRLNSHLTTLLDSIIAGTVTEAFLCQVIRQALGVFANGRDAVLQAGAFLGTPQTLFVNKQRACVSGAKVQYVAECS